jgi:hypothetical protein
VTHRMIAPYAMLKVHTDRGLMMIGYYANAILPETVDADDLARLVRKGAVEEVGKAEAKELAKADADAEKAEADAAKAAQEQAKADGEAAAKAAAEAAKPATPKGK